MRRCIRMFSRRDGTRGRGWGLSQGLLKYLSWWSAALPECKISRSALLHGCCFFPIKSDYLSFCCHWPFLAWISRALSSFDAAAAKGAAKCMLPTPQRVSSPHPANHFFISRELCLESTMKMHLQRQGNASVHKEQNHGVGELIPFMFPIFRLQREEDKEREADFDICLSSNWAHLREPCRPLSCLWGPGLAGCWRRRSHWSGAEGAVTEAGLGRPGQTGQRHLGRGGTGGLWAHRTWFRSCCFPRRRRLAVGIGRSRGGSMSMRSWLFWRFKWDKSHQSLNLVAGI